jgi:hypothetical protein
MTETMSRREVFSILGLAALGLAVPSVTLMISDAEAQTAQTPPSDTTATQAPQTRRQRRRARRAARAEARQTRRKGNAPAPAATAPQ